MIDGLQQGEGVEDRRFLVVGILAGQLLHRLLVALAARSRGHAVVAGVRLFQRAEPVALPLRPGQRLALLDGVQPALEALGGPRRHERIGPLADRQPPVRHRAVRIGGDHGLERLDALGIEERVQDRDRPLELRLDGRLARRRKAHGPELAPCRLRRHVRGRPHQRGRAHRDDGDTDQRVPHDFPLTGDVCVRTVSREPRSVQRIFPMTIRAGRRPVAAREILDYADTPAIIPPRRPTIVE